LVITANKSNQGFVGNTWLGRKSQALKRALVIGIMGQAYVH
jgi:hypothetical protein